MSELIGSDRRMLDRARISRDPRFDGKFFIAVTSTGIYCRPICPSPRSKSKNVIYYSTAAAAAEAGFRPCLRCRPEAAPGTPAWLGTSAVIRRALKLIHEGALDNESVERFAAHIGVGPRHLHRLFVRHVGASPIAVAQTRRLHFAKRLLDETSLPMTEIALAAGFGSLRRFNDAFHKTYGRAPREFRKQRRRNGLVPHDEDEFVLRLAYRPPYDWNQVHRFLAARAMPGVERVDAQGYARTIAHKGTCVVVHIRPLSNEEALELRVRGAAPDALFQLSMTAKRVFDLAADPAQISATFEADPLVGPLVRRCPGLRIPGAWDPFECAVRAVLDQDLTIEAQRLIASRLMARFGQPIAPIAAGLTHLFPSAATLAMAELDQLACAGPHIAAIRSLARAVCDGTIDFSAPMEDLTLALTAIPGIGESAAQYVALRALGEPDVFPMSRLLLKRLRALSSHPLSEQVLSQRVSAWRPWRSYAAMHLWCAADNSAAPFRHLRRLRRRVRLSN